MNCRPAPCVAAALVQADEKWPGRSDASDGTCASDQHHAQNPGSDHEPGADGLAEAFDLTDDPAHGVDTAVEAERLRQRRDWRIKYVICDQRMFSSYSTRTRPAWTWGPYTGANPHRTHMHVSIIAAARYDTSPWWEDDDMADLTPEQLDQIADRVVVRMTAAFRDLIVDVNVIRDSVAGRRTPTHDNPEPRSTTGRIEDDVNELVEAVAKITAAVVPPA